MEKIKWTMKTREVKQERRTFHGSLGYNNTSRMLRPAWKQSISARAGPNWGAPCRKSGTNVGKRLGIARERGKS